MNMYNQLKWQKESNQRFEWTRNINLILTLKLKKERINC
jgi:hypothetical protein